MKDNTPQLRFLLHFIWLFGLGHFVHPPITFSPYRHTLSKSFCHSSGGWCTELAINQRSSPVMRVFGGKGNSEFRFWVRLSLSRMGLKGFQGCCHVQRRDMNSNIHLLTHAHFHLSLGVPTLFHSRGKYRESPKPHGTHNHGSWKLSQTKQP